MTTTGRSHHRVEWCGRTIMTTRVMATRAAIIQSSPMMKSYQNLPKLTIAFTIPYLGRAALNLRFMLPPQEQHVSIGHDDKHGKDSEDSAIRARPGDSRPFGCPERPERCEQQPHRELERVFRDASERAVDHHTGHGDQNHGRRGPD